MLGGMTGFRIKFQEAGGTKLASFFSTDLGKGAHCGRSPCPPCDTHKDGKRPNCRSSNIVYESVCTVCNPQETTSRQNQPSTRQENPDATSDKLARRGRTGVYIGETSRSVHERSCEHLRDAVSRSVKSHMVKHWMLDHADLVDMPEFRFTVQSQYKDALSRQVGEAIAIMHSRDTLLNSKSEYMTNCLSRVTVDERDFERKHREMQEELNEKEELKNLERFIKEKEAAVRTLRKDNEKTEEPAFKRRKLEPDEPPPQSPMTITASG